MSDREDGSEVSLAEKATSGKALKVYMAAGGLLALIAVSWLGYSYVTLKPGETAGIGGVEIIQKTPRHTESITGAGPTINAYCEEVTGLDTMVLKYGELTERVRLIGVKPPECASAGELPEECLYYTKWMAEDRDLLVEFDETGRDEAGRVLAYIFLDNGVMLNEEIIRQGYGSVCYSYPFARRDEFRQMEEDAKLHQRGIWKSEVRAGMR